MRFAAPLVGLCCAPALAAQGSFVHWETPHVHPLELVPGGASLLAVNLPDARLEVFALGAGSPAHTASIPVGLDPVTVRARTAQEAWVVNHVSDSVSVVDLATGSVVRTLATEDEPTDVVFAGTPARAFVCCSQANCVLVFDLADLDAAPVRLALRAEDPRALAVSPDGARVYAAVFESGNRTTVLGGGGTTDFLPPPVVSWPGGPYGGQNPPPNAGAAFEPPIDPALPPPPAVGLIVRQDAAGAWRDDNGADWTVLVSGSGAPLGRRPEGYVLLDHDLAVIDAQSLALSYADHLMNACMALAVHPSGVVTVVGTDATNEVRFVPNLTGRFLRSELALVEPASGASLVRDLNPHLDYASGSVSADLRARTLADPRGIAWSADGTRAYVTGQGSDAVVVLDAIGARAGLAPAIPVGEGPTGVVVDDARGLLYVLDKRSAAISVVSLASETELERVAFFDPTPAPVRAGRRTFYDARASGLGLTACAACHVDARTDRLAWDLGDPTGAVEPLRGNLGAGIPLISQGFEDWHPMKGPMLTLTLVDAIGHEPFHWRGERASLADFAPAFVELLGADQQPDAQAMAGLAAFLGSIRTPPNPYRALDNALAASVPLSDHRTSGMFSPAGQPLPDGDARNGRALFELGLCSGCHTRDTGEGTSWTLEDGVYRPIPPGPDGEAHHLLVPTAGFTNVTMKVPQLRSLYERTGADFSQLESTAGFGLLHDGSFDSLSRFVSLRDARDDQETADLIAYLLSISGGSEELGSPATLLDAPATKGASTHAAVGRQVTIADGAAPPAAALALLDSLAEQAELGRIGLVARARRDGEARGWVYRRGSGRFASDRRGEELERQALLAGAGPGAEVTFTAVPQGSQVRLGVDRDGDGAWDGDERDAGTDPADPGSRPAGPARLGPRGVAGTLAPR